MNLSEFTKEFLGYKPTAIQREFIKMLNDNSNSKLTLRRFSRYRNKMVFFELLKTLKLIKFSSEENAKD